MLLCMTSPLPLPLGPLTPRLEVVPVDDQCSIFLNGHLVARYPCHDRGTERIFVTQLAEVLPLPDRQLAAAFGLHPVTLSRFRQQARPGGAAALMPRKTGPQRPHKIESATGGPLPRFARSGALLAGYRRAPVAPRLNYLPPPRGGPVPRPADPAPQPALPLETGTPPEPDDSSTVAAARSGESRFTRYAGALLLYAALGRLDLCCELF